MSWCERNRVGYVFGLAGNKVLLRRVAGLAEEVGLARVEGGAAKVRRFGEFAYAAETWDTERRVIARVEASEKGADSRFVVTNLAGTPRWLYEVVYCAIAAKRTSTRHDASQELLGVDAREPGPRPGGPVGAERPQALDLVRVGRDQPDRPPSDRGAPRPQARHAAASDRPSAPASPDVRPAPAASPPRGTAARP